MKLGFLLSTSPYHDNTNILVPLIETAKAQGDDVYLYLLDHGVACLHDPRYRALIDQGVVVYACTQGAVKHTVEVSDERVVACGLVMLADLMRACDRFVSFSD